jgi:hypothetical protein
VRYFRRYLHTVDDGTFFSKLCRRAHATRAIDARWQRRRFASNPSRRMSNTTDAIVGGTSRMGWRSSDEAQKGN